MDSAPMLGDFRKLYWRRASTSNQLLSLAAAHEGVDSLRDQNDQELQSSMTKAIKLGDFERVQSHLQDQITRAPSDVDQTNQETFVASQGSNATQKSSPKNVSTGRGIMSGLPKLYRKSLVSAYRQMSREQPQTTSLSFEQPVPTLRRHLSASHGHSSISGNMVREYHSDIEIPCVVASCNTAPPTQVTSKSPQTTSNITILSYKPAKHGPISSVSDTKFSLDQQHESLLLQLIPLRAGDASIMAKDVQVALNGVHVFLDMSNINISFHRALRRKYSIAENARFVPLPQLNLNFLTEILVRGRRTLVLNVGCSVMPRRPEPRYVQELRELGYRVDIRERTQVSELRNWSCKENREVSSSDELATARKIARYMEELVDETLQTRIAESVMECFSKPGTLVIATGDAQPAKYSDGFFTYAERALKMGWHVEVVSWKISLSSHWQKLVRTQKWGERFRIIILDNYLEELLM
ncbi:hypothetical protein QQS21_001797 [Conoideocrella luteorostrata]|uniref:Uncharacterized protein n=1 Tax=Conoideocrella luteorostrata TaxID=1105319 RepID=A0AAJ0CWK6_9HYPO|nr:hypothetical protein QQS21_001797 [Conoideocrella luteorostrata]